MSSYRVSEDTKKALIQAAGELFAERGLELVSVRQITERAGVKVSAISYHFRGKEGLIKAVEKYAESGWNNKRLEDHYQQNQHLLETADGQRQLVMELFEMLFAMIGPEGQPAWVNMFLMRRILNWWVPKEDTASRRLCYPAQVLLCSIYQRITGNDDQTTAQCWFVNVVGAAVIYASNLTTLSKVGPGEKINYAFYRRIQYYAIRNAFYGLGLAEK